MQVPLPRAQATAPQRAAMAKMRIDRWVADTLGVAPVALNASTVVSQAMFPKSVPNQLYAVLSTVVAIFCSACPATCVEEQITSGAAVPKKSATTATEQDMSQR